MSSSRFGTANHGAPLTRRLCPRDYEDQFPAGGFKKLCDIFNIPEEFRSERASNVSYSFGERLQGGDFKGVYWRHRTFPIPNQGSHPLTARTYLT